MSRVSRRAFIVGVSACCASACSADRALSASDEQGFMCPPCGCSQDGVLFDRPGQCPACSMVLQPTHDPELGHEPDALPTGCARYSVAGVQGRFTVHFYQPAAATGFSRVLVVLPGAGRNGDDYRNAWLSAAEQHGLLLLSLEFPESSYDLSAYNLSGIARRLEFPTPEIERINDRARVVRLSEDPTSVTLEPHRQRWIFEDVRRAVAHAAGVLDFDPADFDLFGHSAGAQIAHRLALFAPTLTRGHIVAANAGWYTSLTDPLDFPLGRGGVDALPDNDAVLRARLTVLLGEKDNSDGAGGTLLRTPSIDRLQGLHRFARGQRFFKQAQTLATEEGLPINWRMRTVPQVGHDFRRMSNAAANVLYGRHD